MIERYVVVVEKGLSGASQGATISTSAAVGEAEGLALLQRAAVGEEPTLYRRPRNVETLRVSDRQYLVVSRGRATPTALTRLTLAEVVESAV